MELPEREYCDLITSEISDVFVVNTPHNRYFIYETTDGKYWTYDDGKYVRVSYNPGDDYFSIYW